MSRTVHRGIRQCPCRDCRESPKSATAEQHRTINRVVASFDEKGRRLFVAYLASQSGRGAIEHLAQITGMSPNTIRRGLADQKQPLEDSPYRVRQPGGGRKPVEKKDPAVIQALENLLQDVTAGDPSTGMKWTHKSIRRLCRTLRRQGFSIGRTTVRRLLHQRKYCLRTNRKRLAGTHDKDRDRQFRYLVRQRHRYLKHGWPVISVDTKTKELVGNFKNPGRCWRRRERVVLDHDFRRYAVGIGIPYGIYDEGRNAGFVVLGVSHDTAAFAIAAIRQWWLQVGQKHYSKAKRWLIEADGGGSNGSRNWLWKAGLQALADEFQVIIAVSHTPPGASKWNLIDHRMFSLISENWAGEPLESYAVMLKWIQKTRSETGFTCRACLDRGCYPTGGKITEEEKATIHLKPRRVLPKWNYTIWPHKPAPKYWPDKDKC